jgi:hypothetical protein
MRVPIAAYQVEVNGLVAVVGVVVAGLAAYLAIRHLRQLRRVQSAIQRGQAQTEQLRSQMLDALNLHEVIVANDDLKTSINHLSTEFARIHARGDPLHLRLARRDLENAARLVRMGAEGHIMISADHFTHAETLASMLLDATTSGDDFWASSVVLPEFWTHAAAYLRQQEEAIQERKVAIHRVFVFDSQGAYDAESAKHHMKLQHEAGIDVKYLIHPTLTPQDLVVVRKRTTLPTGKRLRILPMRRSVLRETYALECKIGGDKRIDRIDLWSANELQLDMVSKTWWALQGLFGRASDYPPLAAPSDSPLATPPDAPSDTDTSTVVDA